MKSFYTLLISLALIFSACSTSQYSSAPYEDDIYYSSSSPAAPMRNIVVQDQEVRYNTPKYSGNQYDKRITETVSENEQESLSKEKAALKYSGKYQDTDSTEYKVIEIEEEAEKPEYSINVINIDNPYRFYNDLSFYYDPFYSPRFSFGYNWGWGYPYYNSSFYYGLSWDWGFGSMFWDPFWSHNHYYHNYYNLYHWNYGYNTGYGYHESFTKTVNYGHRSNSGNNIISRSQLPRSQRNLNSTSRKSQSVISGTRLNNRSERSSSKRTILNGRRISSQDHRNTHSRSATNNLKQGSNLHKSNESTFNNNRSVFSKTISNTRSNNSGSKRYSKPKSYTNPQNRRQNTSNEYFRPNSIHNKSTSTGTVRKVVNTTSRSRRSSSTINNSDNHNYSTPIRTRTRSRSNSRSSSTISRSSGSSRSSGTRSAGFSIISRSSKSSSSSGTRSSSGSSSGSRSNRSRR
jgi:hypothetical protein